MFAAILAGFLAAGILGLNLWMVHAAQGSVFLQPSGCPPVRTGLLLGVESTLRNGTPNPHFTSRTLAAAELFRSGRIERLLVSGHPDNHGYDEPRDMARELIRLGVPADRIDLDESGRRTWLSIQQARHGRGLEKCTIITDQFHAARALFLARAVHLDAVVFSSPPEVSASGRFDWFVTVREWLARVKAAFDVLSDRD